MKVQIMKLLKRIVFTVVSALAFALLSDDACPKCGGVGVIPQLAKCTNTQCRAGKVFVTTYKYDKQKRRKVAGEVETRKCPCCGGTFNIPVTNSVARKIELKPGTMLVKFKPCDRCGNIQYGNVQFIDMPASPKISRVDEQIKFRQKGNCLNNCQTCLGKGYVLEDCPMCNNGYIRVYKCIGHTLHNHRCRWRLSNCPKCNSNKIPSIRGKIKTTCPRCRGTGTIGL